MPRPRTLSTTSQSTQSSLSVLAVLPKPPFCRPFAPALPHPSQPQTKSTCNPPAARLTGDRPRPFAPLPPHTACPQPYAHKPPHSTRLRAQARREALPLHASGLPLEFVQNKAPKVTASDLSPASWPDKTEHEWCPPGHGDLYPAMVGSGTLKTLLSKGFK